MSEIHACILGILNLAILIGLVLDRFQRTRQHRQLHAQLNGNTEKMILQAKTIATEAATDAAALAAARLIGDTLAERNVQERLKAIAIGVAPQPSNKGEK